MRYFLNFFTLVVALSLNCSISYSPVRFGVGNSHDSCDIVSTKCCDDLSRIRGYCWGVGGLGWADLPAAAGRARCGRMTARRAAAKVVPVEGGRNRDEEDREQLPAVPVRATLKQLEHELTR